MPLEVSSTFAGYTVVRRLGAGGMGEVYLAQHPRLPRSDALKLLGSNVSADPTFRERFLREADLASKLWHPHIVGVHDRGEHDGQLWISMDFVDGADASGLISRRYRNGMPPALVAAIITAVASALDYAHKQGLLHRDVKPANILLTDVDNEEERRILLTDFGIARPLDDASGLTGTNMTVGTVAYTAPEQLMGEKLDGRADQYALAATAYHLLTGSPPFRDTNPAVVISRHLNTTPPALANTRPELAALDHVVAAALAKNPSDRFASCSDFARALSALATRENATMEGVGRTTAAPVASTRPAPVAPTTPAPIKRSVASAADAPTHTRTPSPTVLAPGWYQDPSGKSGTMYWDGHSWHTAPLPAAAPSTPGAYPAARATNLAPVAWGLGIAAVVVIIGVALFAMNQGKDPSPTPAASPGTTERATESAEEPSSSSERSYAPPTQQPSAPQPSAPQSVTGVIVGTCDEGGSCGVRQRTAPYNDAPNLVSNTLQDGATVILDCQTTGDVKASAGHGSSNVWYRLSNGAYVNSVYFNVSSSGLPSC